MRELLSDDPGYVRCHGVELDMIPPGKRHYRHRTGSRRSIPDGWSIVPRSKPVNTGT